MIKVTDMKKIIIILVAVLLFCQCSTMKVENGFCDCIKKETGNKEIGKEENLYPTGELIITEGSCFPEVADKYQYPVYEFVDWNRMLDEERWEKRQLPDDVLKSISTLGLIRSFIDVQWDFDIMISLSSCACYRHNYYAVYEFLNSVQELLTREDAAKSLIIYHAATKLDCYESRDLFNTDDWRSPERDLFYRLKALEYLFTKPEILDRLSHQDKVGLVKSFLSKHKQWQSREINNYSMIPVLATIMGDDMIPCFDEISLNDIRINEDYSEKYLNDVIAFAECFIR